MTAVELTAGFRALGVDIYSAAWTERRRQRFNDRLRELMHRERAEERGKSLTFRT
jgi:hypothetical protein